MHLIMKYKFIHNVFHTLQIPATKHFHYAIILYPQT